MSIHNILWQVNGALFDTYPALTYSFSKALSEMGFSVALNVIDGLVRQSLDDSVDILSGRFKLDPQLLLHKFIESYRSISPASQMPFPGVHDICEFIQRNGGANLALTDTGVEFASRLLETHQFSGWIAGTLFMKNGDASQTDPSLLCAVLDQYSLNPGETLLIVTRGLDVQAGRMAGIRTCLYGRAETNFAADLQIEKYSQLLRLLAGEEGKG
ncbi:MAG TPA: HAD hydrolase-like protein [Anaerolineales bacterium]|nr:HAD hydrolase-like protein [Anaerolineales bacterium]